MSFCLNHGIMELWNDGIVGFQRILSILNFIVKTNFTIYPILQYPKTHYSAKASLRAQYSAKASLRAHHSNWGEAPNLSPFMPVECRLVYTADTHDGR
jgi:hypothetical protein